MKLFPTPGATAALILSTALAPAVAASQEAVPPRTEDLALAVPGGPPGGLFGRALDLDGDRAVVGAPGNAEHAGSAYVFRDHPVQGWILEAKLAPDPDFTHPGQRFGAAVAIDGDLVAVGAPGDDLHGSDAGRVHVYERGPDGWTHLAEVVSDAVSTGDQFGSAVALGLSDETASRVLLAGAPAEGVQGSGTIGEGLAYVFQRQGDNFVLRDRLRGSVPMFLGKFGRSLDYDGHRAVVGADGQAYVFRHLHDESWVEEWRLDPAAAESGAYGQNVRIDGDAAYVSDIYGSNSSGVNCGAVHVFERTGPFSWSESATLSPGNGAPFDGSGSRFDVDGNLLVAQSGNDADGSTTSIYVWQRSGSSWSLAAQVGTPLDFFTNPQLEAGRLLLANSNFDGHFVDEGRVLVLSMADVDQWDVEVALEGTNVDPGEYFGLQTALDGDRAAVASNGDQDSAYFGGAVYVFERGPGGWEATAKLAPGSSAFRQHNFGAAIDLEGDRIAIGAPTPYNDTPAVYVFEHAGSEWTLIQRIDGPPGSSFGEVLDLDGDRLLVGAPGYDSMSVGGAFCYEFDGTTWMQTSYVGVAGTVPQDLLGASVALHGDVAVLGAPGFAAGGPFRGTAYVFDRLGTSWLLRQRLDSETITAYQLFGYDLALTSAHLVVGAPGAGGNVQVFEDAGGAFLHRATLDTDATDGLGSTIAVDGSRIAAAALAEGSTLDSVFVFRETGQGWLEEFELAASDGPGPVLGTGVAIDGPHALLGAAFGAQDEKGLALVYELGEPSPFIPFCFGNGSAAATCPCGNPGAPGTSCAGSTGSGSRLTATGSPSVSAANLVVRIEDAPPSKPGLLFSGTTALGGTPFGDGLRCVGGATRRHGFRTTDATGSTSWTNVIGAFAPTPGQSVYLQVWHRDPQGPCGNGFNLTPGLEVQLAP